jgi:hypothetical protein
MAEPTGQRIPQFILNRVGNDTTITITNTTAPHIMIIAIDVVFTNVMTITINNTVINFTIDGGVGKRAAIYPINGVLFDFMSRSNFAISAAVPPSPTANHTRHGLAALRQGQPSPPPNS